MARANGFLPTTLWQWEIYLRPFSYVEHHRLADANKAGYLVCRLVVSKKPESLAALLRADWSHDVD